MKYIVSFFLFFFSLFTYAQNTVEARTAELINKGRYFDLAKEYSINQDSLSDFFRCFSGALINNAFRKNQEAVKEINHLIDNFQEDMGFPNTTSMVLLLASNYANMGNYAAANKLLKDFLNDAGEYLESTVKQTFISNQILYETMMGAPTSLCNEIIEDVTLPFTIDTIGGKHIFVPATVHNNDYHFMLDNGSSYNVLSKEMADKMNVKLITDSVLVTGTGDTYAQLGVIDSLLIGNIKVNNVYFLIPPSTSKSYLTCILGDPFIRLLKEIQFYPEKNEIIIPREKSKHEKRNVIQVNSQYYIPAKGNDGVELVFHLDLGSGINTLGYKYFSENEEKIKSIGKKSVLRYWGLGGEMSEDVYNIPEIAFAIDNTECKIDDLNVSTTLNDPFMTFADGRLGVAFILKHKKIVLNVESMYFSVY